MDGTRGRNGCRAGRESGAGRARDAGWRLRYADASVPRESNHSNAAEALGIGRTTWRKHKEYGIDR